MLLLWKVLGVKVRTNNKSTKGITTLKVVNCESVDKCVLSLVFLPRLVVRVFQNPKSEPGALRAVCGGARRRKAPAPSPQGPSARLAVAFVQGAIIPKNLPSFSFPPFFPFFSFLSLFLLFLSSFSFFPLFLLFFFSHCLLILHFNFSEQKFYYFE